jgi:arylsulfatase
LIFLDAWFLIAAMIAAGKTAIRQYSILALSLLCFGLLHAADKAAPPNVLVILADDMGFSDTGCYGGEIRTPNLDKLAQGGLRFRQFYNTTRCWPSRGALLTGYYAQQVRRDTVPGVTSGGQGIRPDWARLLPERLQPLGYRTYHSGKWHVDGLPTKSGFDRSFRLGDESRYFTPQDLYENDVKLPLVSLKDNFYMTGAIADYAIKQLREHASNYAGQPFFQYLCFTSPHFPLQAPAEDIAQYANTYRAGWDAARQERWRRIQRLGFDMRALPAFERQLGPPYDFPEALLKLGSGETNRPVPWVELSEVQREFQSSKMAVHAAMVDRMDREIGRVVEQLQAMNAWENTLILFLSDNGASAEIMVRGDGHDPQAAPGSAGSFLCLGPGWSGMANTPFRRHKTWVHEGGISTPLIAHWPKGIASRGEWRRTQGHIIDLAPTIIELAGGEWPSTWNGAAMPPHPGKSLAAAFRKNVAIPRESLWWLHEGNRALRAGDWKIVADKQDAAWELYHLKSDRGETLNVAAKNQARVQSMAELWQKQTDTYFAQAQAHAPAASQAERQK